MLKSELELAQHFGESKTPRHPFLLSPGSTKGWYDLPETVAGLIDITLYEIRHKASSDQRNPVVTSPSELEISQFHRMTEWLGLEGTFEDPPVQPTCIVHQLRLLKNSSKSKADSQTALAQKTVSFTN